MYSTGDFGIGDPMFYLQFQSVFYIFLVLFLESNLWRNLNQRYEIAMTPSSTPKVHEGEEEDDDVTRETAEVLADDFKLEEHSIVMKRVRKLYGRMVAVDGLTVCVKRGKLTEFI